MLERRAPGGAVWLAVPIAALFGLLAPALSGRAILAFRDMLQNYWPMKAVFWGSPGPLLPTWNPWFFSGMPLLGDLAQQPLYLPNLAFRALRVPPWPGIAWYLALHGLLALGSAALLFRRIASRAAAVLGATVFVLSGYLLANLSNLNWYCAAAWAPLVLYACDRVAREGRTSDSALLSLSLAQVVLASDPQLALCLAACCAAILWLRFPTAMGLQPSPVTRAALFSRLGSLLRERAAPLALAAAGAVVLCVPQIIASQQLLQLVVRGAALAQDAARETWSFHPARIPELWVPRLYGPLFEAGYWGGFTVSAGWKRPFIQSVYAGALWPALLAAALLSRRRAALLSLAGAAGFGLLALGEHGFHLYALLGRVVPTWSLYRYPERLLLLPTLAAAAIAALGADALLALPRRAGVALAAGSGALSLASLGLAATLAPSHPWHDPAAHGALLRSGVQVGLATLLACAAIGASRRFLPLLVVLFAVDLCAANGELVGLLPRAPFLEPPRICEDIARAAGPVEPGSFRIFDDQAALKVDTGRLPPAALALPEWGRSRWLEYSWGKRNVVNLCGLRAAVALTSFEPRDATALWHAAGPVRTLAALSTRFAITVRGSTLARAAGMRSIAFDPAIDAVLLEFPEALQRLYRPESVEPGDEAAVLARVAGEPRLLTRRLALLAGPLLEHARADAARVAAFEESGDRIVFSIEHDAQGYWVLTDSLDASWSATVDGAPATLHRADLAHRAIWLAAGRHEVALRARPGALGWLIAASLISLCCLAWLAARR